MEDCFTLSNLNSFDVSTGTVTWDVDTILMLHQLGILNLHNSQVIEPSSPEPCSTTCNTPLRYTDALAATPLQDQIRSILNPSLFEPGVSLQSSMKDPNVATMSPICPLSNIDLVSSPMGDLQDVTGTVSLSESDPVGAMTGQLPRIEQLPPNGSSQKTRKTSRTYGCEVCKYTTSNLKKLGNHMRDEHKRHGFKCNFCATHVTRYDNLKSHQRSCKGIAKRLPTPSLASSMKGERRQRISVLNLQNVAPAPCPTPTRGASPSTNENPINVEISPGLKPADIQSKNSQINDSSSLGDNICSDLSTTNDFLNIDIVQLTVQLEAYKKELRRIKEYLAQMREERDVWRRQYFQSRQPDGYKNEDDIIGSPLAA